MRMMKHIGMRTNEDLSASFSFCLHHPTCHAKTAIALPTTVTTVTTLETKLQRRYGTYRANPLRIGSDTAATHPVGAGPDNSWWSDDVPSFTGNLGNTYLKHQNMWQIFRNQSYQSTKSWRSISTSSCSKKSQEVTTPNARSPPIHV